VSESNFRDELGEVWVPKNVGELEELLLTIQNEPGKKILKHKIQQALKEKEKRHNNWSDTGWEDWDDGGSEHSREWDDYSRDGWPDSHSRSEWD
jgi:hypothetical protein